jgi:hypothetical protein
MRAGEDANQLFFYVAFVPFNGDACFANSKSEVIMSQYLFYTNSNGLRLSASIGRDNNTRKLAFGLRGIQVPEK